MSKTVQLFEFYAIHREEIDDKGNLIVKGLLHPQEWNEPDRSVVAVFPPDQEGIKGLWIGKIQ